MTKDRDWLARFIAHPAIVAMLSAALALGATWWLDHRAAERDDSAAMRRTVEVLIDKASAARIAAAMVIDDATSAGLVLDQESRMQNRQFLLTQFSVAQADLERTLPAALLRLLEYFPKHEESIFKLFLGLDQDSTRLFACANEIGYLDHFADNDAIFDITDGCGLDTLPNSVGSKTDFLQFAGKYGLEARAMRCEIAVLKLLDSAIDDPSVLSDRLDESLLDCGISWQGDSPVRLVDDLGAKQ